MKHTLPQRAWIWLIESLSHIRVSKPEPLLAADQAQLKAMFAKDYYVIATRRGYFLSAFMIALGHFFLTHRWGFYSHVLMNLEDEVKNVNADEFRFIEATGHGTAYASFPDCFDDVDAVALLKPRHMTVDDWTAALDKAKSYLGTPYDNLFDMRNAMEINCVELIRLALHDIPSYATKFAHFERMVTEKKKLTPQMFLECDDFEVVVELRSRR